MAPFLRTFLNQARTISSSRLSRKQSGFKKLRPRKEVTEPPKEFRTLDEKRKSGPPRRRRSSSEEEQAFTLWNLTGSLVKGLSRILRGEEAKKMARTGAKPEAKAKGKSGEKKSEAKSKNKAKEAESKEDKE